MKRRRVDLSLRLEEAIAAAKLLDAGLIQWSGDEQVSKRGERVLSRLRAGVKYVTEDNPSHRPSRAKARNV